jgi:hypothetical protein
MPYPSFDIDGEWYYSEAYNMEDEGMRMAREF